MEQLDVDEKLREAIFGNVGFNKPRREIDRWGKVVGGIRRYYCGGMGNKYNSTLDLPF